MFRAVALLLTIATGTSGLVYEVTWERMLSILLGSHAEATAAVLAFFLGGLAIGYSLFGSISRRIAAGPDAARRLLLAYGAVEAGIGLYALAFTPLFGIARVISPLGPSQAGLAFAWDALLAAALILPGSVLMGATVPFLTQALPSDLRDATRVHAAIYGTNTLGAFVGALAASYALIPALGLDGTLRAMAMVNLAAGMAFVLLSLLPRNAGVAAPAVQTGAPPLHLGRYALAAFLFGAAMMTLQTTVIRVGSLSLGASLFTFATVVAVFVLCIAIGSLAVGSLSRVPATLLPAVAWGLFGWLLGLYLLLDDAPYFAHVLRSLFRDQRQAFLPYHLAVLLALMATIGPAIVLSGTTLPLLFDRLRRERGDLGDAAGRLYGWNTAGSLIGALFGGYALFHWLDLHHVYRLAAASLAVAAALLTPLPRFAVGRLHPALAALPALMLLALLPSWQPENLSIGAFRSREPLRFTYEGPAKFVAQRWSDTKIIFADDDPTATIVVSEKPGQPRTRAILTNGKSDGSIHGDYTTMGMAGLLAAWMARSPERSFVIGYGTGVTAGELAALEESREVIVAEISPAVAAAAPLFDPVNQGALSNPKVRLVRGDAYRVLLRSTGRYDVIVSEPSNPWVTGVEMLYSREFLEAAKDHLSDGGVFCQWFHSYETDRETVELVLRTYASVFDHVAIWYGLGIDYFLIAFDDPETALDLERLAARAAREDFRAGFSRAGANGLTEVLAHELWPVGVLHALELEGPLHTLLHPRLAHTAARAFFQGASGTLPVSASARVAELAARNSLIRRYAAQRGGLSESERRGLVAETCRLRPRECITLLAQWHVEQPDSAELAALVARIRAHPDFSRQIPLRQVQGLEPLFGGGQIPDGGDPVRRAKRGSDLFVRYYHHAAPFPRAVLRRLFDACAEPPERAEACAAARRKLEATLGPLDAAG